MEGLRGEIVVQNTHCYMSCGKLEDFRVLFKQCLPAMMLNILGLRMAGQISLRKTKPLEEQMRYVRLNKNKH